MGTYGYALQNVWYNNKILITWLSQNKNFKPHINSQYYRTFYNYYHNITALQITVMLLY